MLNFRWTTPSVAENGPEQNSCLLWAPTPFLHEPIFHTAGCEIIFALPQKRAPHAEIHKFMSIHHQHVKREDVVKTECERAEGDSEGGKTRRNEEEKNGR